MNNIWAWLIGKKTYGIALLWVIYAVTAYALHQITGSQFYGDLFMAAGIAGLRHGVSTTLGTVTALLQAGNTVVNNVNNAVAPVQPTQ